MGVILVHHHLTNIQFNRSVTDVIGVLDLTFCSTRGSMMVSNMCGQQNKNQRRVIATRKLVQLLKYYRIAIASDEITEDLKWSADVCC